MAPKMFHQVCSLYVWHLGTMLPVAIALPTIILTEYEQTTTSKDGTVASIVCSVDGGVCSDRDTQSRATQYGDRGARLLQAGKAPPVQCAVHRHITDVFDVH